MGRGHEGEALPRRVRSPQPGTGVCFAASGPGFAFHYSRDASYWHMVRAFQLLDAPVRAGFLVQSPHGHGHGCRVRFTEISCRPETLADIRNGE